MTLMTNRSQKQSNQPSLRPQFMKIIFSFVWKNKIFTKTKVTMTILSKMSGLKKGRRFMLVNSRKKSLINKRRINNRKIISMILRNLGSMSKRFINRILLKILKSSSINLTDSTSNQFLNILIRSTLLASLTVSLQLFLTFQICKISRKLIVQIT